MSIERKGILVSLNEVIRTRNDRGLLRSLYTTTDNVVDFSSNDYLGIARAKELVDMIAIERETYSKRFPLKNLGSTGSRLLSGNNEYYEEVEAFLATFHNGEDALLFNSGYDLNLSILGALPQKGDIILFDELVHNSMREGMKLSRGNAISFKHNNLKDLESKLVDLNQHSGNIIVFVEGVYSMDGHTAPLLEMCDLVERYGADIVVDEAHSTGIYGEKGQGIVNHLGLEDRVFCRVHTFGKAVGAHGAVVIGPSVLKSYLLNYARPLIYSTSLPAESLIAIKCSYKFMSSIAKERQSKVFQLVEVFQSRKLDMIEALKQGNGDLSYTYLESPSPIQGVIIPGNKNCVNAGKHLLSEGFDVKPIRSPTVPAGTERLRIILHYHNTIDEVHKLMDIVQEHLLRNMANM